MRHVDDELELFALGALTAPEGARVSEHLAACPACRALSVELTDIVGALPDTIPPREAPAALRERILTSARAELRVGRAVPASGARRLFTFRPAHFGFAGLAAAVVILGVLDLRGMGELRSAESERAVMQATVQKLGAAGRSWYMAGAEQWKGSGGTLVLSQSDGKAAVLFHDLKPIPADKVYTLWLVSPDNRWVRSANVRPDGRQMQLVELAPLVDGYDRCLVTLEDGSGGRREGPIVMQSRIAPAP